MVSPADRQPAPDLPAGPALSGVEGPAFPNPVSNVPAAAPVSWGTVMIALYVAGVIGLLLYRAGQHWRLRRLARRATVVHEAEWTRLLAECARTLGIRRAVRLLRSREHTVPAAFGTFRPAILIPAVADLWDDDRRRAVMLHELAHVARRDCLTQTIAACACAAYWFHPAMWWVARRLRIERELACDDRVIAAGTEAREYAGHLLEIAYAFGTHRAPALAVSMARPRQLEGRMLAALDDTRNRRLPALRLRWASVATAAVLLLVLACARPTTVVAGTVQEAVAQPPAAQGAGHESYIERATRFIRAAAEALGFVQIGAGTWEIRPTDTKGTVQLRLTERGSSSGSNIPIEQLDGLTTAQLAGAGGPVQFRLRRDAGTFTFEGVIRNGVGAGTFSFAADPTFPAELAKRGFSQPTAGEQYQLARHDIGFAFLDELTRQGYAKPQTADLVRAGQHGVQATYLREMAALGYKFSSLDPLITLRDHGITPAYVRELAELGYKGLTADAIRNARDHGITPDYVRAMRDAGYGSVPMDALINARDHGITPEYVRELGEAGHSKLPLDQLIRVRDHGVLPDYVREMRKLGYPLSIDQLVEARDHGITVDYVRDMAALGYANIPMPALIRVRDHGVTAQYAQELKALGYDRLAIDDLVMLRDHGMTPDRIKQANARAGTRLPIDMLKSLARGGE